jgi:ribosomal 30S subunit maturation factor RimM
MAVLLVNLVLGGFGPEGGERLLPYVPTVISDVDFGSGVLRVDWGIDW